MTPKDLIKAIENNGDRYYSYDTPVDCQKELIRKLKNQFERVRVVGTVGELLALNTFNVLIIQDAQKIIDGLESLTPLEKLIKSNAFILIFFNGDIEDKEKKNDWLTLLENKRDLLIESFMCKEKTVLPTGGLCRRIKKFKVKVSKYIWKKKQRFVLSFVFLVLSGLVIFASFESQKAGLTCWVIINLFNIIFGTSVSQIAKKVSQIFGKK